MTKTIESLQLEVPKMLLKKAISNHKKFALQGKNVESSSLSAIQFEVENDSLILRTTDGNRALISNIEILASKGDVEGQTFLLSMEQVSKVVIKKDGVLNSMAIIKNGDFIEFYDMAFETTQKLKIRKDNFLNIKKAIPENNSFKVSIASYQIKALSSIKADSGLDFYFDINNPNKAVLIKSNNETLEQQAIVQPLTKTEEDKV